jgi:hypothetical protein
MQQMRMQLRVARLCLDCEEIHDSRQCPVCASETFAYLSRWVPTPERRERPRPNAATPPQPRSRKVAIGFGVAGLGLVAAARWWAKGRERLEEAAVRNAGELR